MKVKITVLKRLCNQDLADQYLMPGAALLCPELDEGQEFLVESSQDPEGFCSAAWRDLYPYYLILSRAATSPGGHGAPDL